MRWATAHQRGVLRRAWNSGAAQAMLRCMHTVPHAGDELVTVPRSPRRSGSVVSRGKPPEALSIQIAVAPAEASSSLGLRHRIFVAITFYRMVVSCRDDI